MESQSDHCHDVEKGDPPQTKAGHDVRVHVLVTEDTRGPDSAGREMQDVQDDEHQQQCTAPPHRARSDGSSLRLMLLVPNGTRGSALPRQLHRGNHVKNDRDDEHDPQRPEKLTGTLQEMRVRIDRGRSAKDEQIAERVKNYEADPDQSGNAHDDFLADHGRVEAA